jgi:hypothetical protein
LGRTLQTEESEKKIAAKHRTAQKKDKKEETNKERMKVIML